MKLIVTILLCLVPVFVWGLYFYRKNPRKGSLSDVLSVFLIGLLSVIPIYVFYRYLEHGLIPFLQDFFILQNGSVELVVMTLTIVGIFAVLFMLLFALLKATALYLFYGMSWKKDFLAVIKSFYSIFPLLFVLLIFFFLELLVQEFTGLSFLGMAASTLILFIVIEEYCKYMIIPFLSNRTPHTVASVVVNSIYVGLAFALVENVVFLVNIEGWQEFAWIYLFRSVVTTAMHVCVAGMLGYFYSLTLFSKQIVTSYEIDKATYKRFEWLTKLFKLKKHTIFSGINFTQGFFVAMFIHGVFNLLIFYGDRVFSTIFVFLCVGLLIYLINMKSSRLIYGIVGTSAMPDNDFYDLRLKISVLKHIKEIKEKVDKKK